MYGRFVTTGGAPPSRSGAGFGVLRGDVERAHAVGLEEEPELTALDGERLGKFVLSRWWCR